MLKTALLQMITLEYYVFKGGLTFNRPVPVYLGAMDADTTLFCRRPILVIGLMHDNKKSNKVTYYALVLVMYA